MESMTFAFNLTDWFIGKRMQVVIVGNWLGLTAWCVLANVTPVRGCWDPQAIQAATRRILGFLQGLPGKVPQLQRRVSVRQVYNEVFIALTCQDQGFLSSSEMNSIRPSCAQKGFPDHILTVRKNPRKVVNACPLACHIGQPAQSAKIFQGAFQYWLLFWIKVLD